ncbi:MAG: hypothetical protein ACR2IQ_01970 [Minisyncoccia bacterium]
MIDYKKVFTMTKNKDALLKWALSTKKQPMWLYQMFNPIYLGFVVFNSSWLVCHYFFNEKSFPFNLISSTISTAVFFSMVYIFFGQLYGHGIGFFEKGKFSVLGLPSTPAKILFWIFVTILMMIISSFYQSSKYDKEFYIMCSTSSMYGLIWSTICWRFNLFFKKWNPSYKEAYVFFKREIFSKYKGKMNNYIKQDLERKVIIKVNYLVDEGLVYEEE